MVEGEGRGGCCVLFLYLSHSCSYALEQLGIEMKRRNVGIVHSNRSSSDYKTFGIDYDYDCGFG